MNSWIAAILAGSLFLTEMPSALAKSELSGSRMVPFASVVEGASTLASEGASAVVALPAVLSEAGASFLVLSITEGAKGSVYLLERAGDGARVSIEIGGEIASTVALAVGTTIQTSAVSAGTVLSVAGEVIALLPSEAGRALLHHEQLSD